MIALKDLWRHVVEFGFRLLYHEMAFTYDSVSWLVSMGEWRSWQRAALKHLNVRPGTCVLELAHGTGNLQLDLHAVGLKPIGLDFSPYMGRIARDKLTRHHVPYTLVRGRAQALPFGTESFAVIVSTFPTDFIIDPATIAEAYRVLKPGGRLVFVPNGVLTRGGIARQGIEAAYRATGQADWVDTTDGSHTSSRPNRTWPIQVTDRFTSAGFMLTHVMEQCQSSIAQVVIAEKPAHPA